MIRIAYKPCKKFINIKDYNTCYVKLYITYIKLKIGKLHITQSEIKFKTLSFHILLKIIIKIDIPSFFFYQKFLWRHRQVSRRLVYGD